MRVISLLNRSSTSHVVPSSRNRLWLSWRRPAYGVLMASLMLGTGDDCLLAQDSAIPAAIPVEQDTNLIAPPPPAITPSAIPKAEPVTEDEPPSTSTTTEEEEPRASEKPPATKPQPPPKPASRVPAPEQNLFDYANMLYGRRSYDLSAQQYRLYLTTYPRGHYTMLATYRLAESYLHLGMVEEAEATYRRLIEVFKTGDYVANSAYRLGSIAYNRRDFASAARFFGIAAAQSKQEAIRHSSIYYRGRSLSEQNQIKAAYAEYEKLSKYRTNNDFWSRALVQMGRIDEQLNRPKQALAHYLRVAEEEADPRFQEYTAEALIKSSRMLKDAGEPERAVAGFEKVLQLRGEKVAPWLAVARYGLIESYHQAGQWQQVVATYNATSSVELSEDQRPRLWLLVGDAQSKLKQYRRALDFFLLIDQYHPTAPENVEAGYRILVCLNELRDPGMPATAERVIARIKQINPKSEQLDLCYFILAEFYFTRQIYANAAAAYREVRADKLPENLRGAMLFRRGWACEAAGDYAGAIAALSPFIEAYPQDPNVPQALAKRGLAYKATEAYKNAQDDFDRILREFEDSPVAELAYEQSALLKGQRKDPAGMIATFEEMLRKFPHTRAAAEAWFWIGSGHFELKDYEKAIPALQKALEIDEKTYEKEANLRILVSYYYLQDVKNLTRMVEQERRKPEPETRVPREVYQYLGLKYFEAGNMPEADKYLTFASTPDRPQDTDYRIWFTLSEARLANGHFEGAVQAADFYLRKADLPPPQQAKGLLNKARALYGLQKYAEAAPVINEALRLQPEARVQGNLRILNGDIALAQGDPAEAAQRYVVPSQMFDDEEIAPLALWKLVQALEMAGNTVKAKEYREDLSRRFPKYRPPEGAVVPTGASPTTNAPSAE